MRGGFSTRFDAVNDFVLNSHILAELRKKLKSKMRLKTASKHKEATYGEMERQEEQIQSLLKNLKTYVNPFHGEARNMAVSIFNGLLSSRKKDKERLKEFIEKRLTCPEKGFYKPIKRSGI